MLTYSSSPWPALPSRVRSLRFSKYKELSRSPVSDPPMIAAMVFPLEFLFVVLIFSECSSKEPRKPFR
jgi:hypothetical protein